jgi:septum formation protein
MDIILASTSPYRRHLLERFGIPFECQPPNIDEAPMPGELPAALATRLALEKAQTVAQQYPEALVIGSDQVAALQNRLLGKPGNKETAQEQLSSCSGREVQFYTGLALVCSQSGYLGQHVEPFSVRFRTLTASAINNYLDREQPYDCAGSFKWEGLGIVLFTELSGRDPTSLEGLPLIALTTLLLEAGVEVLGSHRK